MVRVWILYLKITIKFPKTNWHFHKLEHVWSKTASYNFIYKQEQVLENSWSFNSVSLESSIGIPSGIPDQLLGQVLSLHCASSFQEWCLSVGSYIVDWEVWALSHMFCTMLSMVSLNISVFLYKMLMQFLWRGYHWSIFLDMLTLLWRSLSPESQMSDLMHGVWDSLTVSQNYSPQQTYMLPLCCAVLKHLWHILAAIC